MCKDKFLKLGDYNSNGFVYIDPEEIKEFADLPKTDRHSARTSVVTTKSLYLVRESSEKIHIMIISNKKPKAKQ